MKKLSLVVLGVVLSSWGCGGEEEDPPDVEPACKVEGRDVELCLRSFGLEEAPTTVVMIPGGPGWGSGYLTSLAENLASDAVRVVTYDPRGVGSGTRPNPPSYTLEDYAADLEAVRVKLGTEQIHLLAHSWSSLVAYHYLQSHPGRARGLILAGAFAPQDWQNAEAKGMLADRISFMQNSDLLPDPIPPDDGNDCNPPFRATLPAFFHDWDNLDLIFPDELANNVCAVEARDATEHFLDNVDYDYANAAAAYEGPLLVIYGKSDPHGPQLGVHVLGGFSSTSAEEDVTLPGSGHFPWFELQETQLFENHLRDFLAAHP